MYLICYLGTGPTVFKTDVRFCELWVRYKSKAPSFYCFSGLMLNYKEEASSQPAVSFYLYCFSNNFFIFLFLTSHQYFI